MTDDEEWKIIEDFPDFAVSSHGRVKRIAPGIRGGIVGTFLTPTVGNHKYMIVTVRKNGRQWTKTVHKMVCQAFHGLCPNPGWHAAHTDGDRSNNNKGNLSWKSPSDNAFDKNTHGTMRVGENHHANYNRSCMPRGSGHGNAKLTEEAVSAIRADARPHPIVAKDYGVTASLIYQVRSGRIWAHVK